MQGRNGSDDVARVCAAVALVLALIYMFVPAWPLSAVALALVVYCWWRMTSKDVAARARENERFMGALGPLRPWVANPGSAFSSWRSYKTLTCPSCGQRARVPRGKGKVRVRCRRCGTRFEGKA